MRRNAHFLRHALTWLLLVGVLHALAVWALPRVVMHVAMVRLVAAAPARPSGVPPTSRARMVFPPMSTAASRVIVLPSPDLAYAICVYDLSAGPVDIDAAPDWSSYWSVALYAANTDNYLVRNDRAAQQRPVHWRLQLPGTSIAPLPAGRELVVAPTARGLVLLRLLVADRERQAVTAARAQHALQCVAR